MFPNLKADQIIALNITQESDSIPFPMKDVFVKQPATSTEVEL